MKWFSTVMIALMFAFLVGISVGEDFVVTNAMRDVMNDCLYIEKICEDKTDIRESLITLGVDDIESRWLKNESGMCYLVNHKNIQEIGTEIAKLKVYQAENEIGEFKACITAIKAYSQSYLHFMGASLHNVF